MTPSRLPESHGAIEKVVFLDIDGVLISTKSQRLSHDPLYIPPGATALVNEILEATGAKLVLSSTWRRDQDGRARLAAAGLRPEFHPDWRTQPFLEPAEMIDADYSRGSEIAEWLSRHPGVRYCILDDVMVLPAQMAQRIGIDPKKGLTQAHVNMAIAMLNGSEPQAADTAA